MLRRRIVISAAVVVSFSAVVGAAPPAAQGDDAKNAQPFPPPEARRAADAKDAPEVLELLRQRREVVRSELALAARLLDSPQFRADVWAALCERLLIAETEAAESPAERLAAYRAYRDNLRRLEGVLRRVPEPVRGQGLAEYGRKLWVESRRLQAEAWLLQAEQGGRAAPAGGADRPAVRAALVAWRDAVHRWADAWLKSKVVVPAGLAQSIATQVLEADLATATSPAERLAAHREYRDRLAAVEKDLREEVEKRRYDPSDYLRLKEARCEADVLLGRLRNPSDKLTPNDPPDVRRALDEWAEAVRFDFDVSRKRFGPDKVPVAESLATDACLLRQELAAAVKPDDKAAAYRKYVARLKQAEAAEKTREPANKVALARLTLDRAAAELALLRLTTPPGAKTSPEERRLLGEEHEALHTELAAQAADWAAGGGDFQALQETAGRLLLADLTTAEGAPERLNAYRRHADAMRSAEKSAEGLVAEKKGSESWLLWARGARLEAEVWLLRARRNLSPAASGP